MEAYLEFLRAHETICRDNQRVLISNSLEDADRALRLLDLPEEVWTTEGAIPCVMAFKKILASGEKPTLFSVQEELIAAGNKDAISKTIIHGQGYLSQMEWNDAYKSVLKFHERRKRFIHLKVAAQKLNETTDLEKWDQEHLTAAANLQGKAKRKTGGTNLEIVQQEIELVQKGEDRTGFIEIGMDEIDKRTDGFGPGQLVVIGGRPGDGKTSFADQLARHIARHYGPVYFEELEMNLRELARRNIATTSGRSMKNWRPQDLTKALTEAQKNENLYYETAGGRIDDFLARIHKRMLLHPDTKAIFVDYLGLLQNFGKGYNDTSEASAVSSELKHLAQHYQVLVVAMQQLNRNNESRVDKRPRISDLRDSGKIGQDAHKILCLHHPHRYDKSQHEAIMECHILKDRQGQAGGYIDLYRRPSIFRFEILDQAKINSGPKQVFEHESKGPRLIKQPKGFKPPEFETDESFTALMDAADDIMENL